MKKILTLLSLLFMLLIADNAQAAHLVGGELSYECLGGNLYEIRLRMYRDCAGGGAGFDEIAQVAVYDSTGNLVRQIFMNHGIIRAVSRDSVGNNPCVSAPPTLCTQYVDYIDTVRLPPISGGYNLSHQRCCRNSIIQNIPNPGNYGNTYSVSIPSNDTSCNSSPQLLEVPPIVFCSGEPLSFPMNVDEKDGDSLHFELCDIYAGGRASGVTPTCNTWNIIPSPPCPPPYNAIPFLPPYSSSNPMPANPPINIHPQTGVFTGTPTQLGTYVLGICVSEYRNGHLMSEVRLDYQFVTTTCIQNIVSDMLTPAEDAEMLCDGLTINFENQSTNATSVYWDFGDPTTNSDTSTLFNPTYTYPSTGSYNVMLVADPGSVCGDTTSEVFKVEVPVQPRFRYIGQTCFDAQNVDFVASGGFPTGSTFTWEFGPEANIPVFHGFDPPTIIWSSPGKHYIDFTVQYGACSYTVRDSIFISHLSTTIDAGPDEIVKAGEVVRLQASGGVEYYWYSKEQGIELSSRITAESFLRTFEEDTILMYVHITDQYGCSGIDSLYVYVLSNEIPGPINFISPDGNGLNDVLDLREINPDNDCRISILNRWGSEVWSELNYANDWRGMDKGGYPLPDGTYYYILECDGEVFYKSAVSIVRNE